MKFSCTDTANRDSHSQARELRNAFRTEGAHSFVWPHEAPLLLKYSASPSSQNKKG
jgi:hypothetical protein